MSVGPEGSRIAISTGDTVAAISRDLQTRMHQYATALEQVFRQRLAELKLLAQRKWTGTPSAAAFWERFNTARSFAFLLWTTVLISLLSPIHTPPVAVQGMVPVHSVESPQLSATHHGTSAGGAHEYTSQGEIRASISPERARQLDECWGASRIRVNEALVLAGPLEGVLVAVLDTGIDTSDGPLADCVVEQISLVDSTHEGDPLGHGTHVASTIAAIAPNCAIIDIKVADDRGKCTAQDVAKGILSALGRGVDVINLSLEVEPSPALESAIHQAWLRGAVMVAAAGMPEQSLATLRVTDDSSPKPVTPCRPAMSRPVYPAAYPEVIAVTGTNEDDELAPVCNRGLWVDVAAPGHRTLAVLPGGSHGLLTGSSTACAHVTGVAALLCGMATDVNGNGSVNDEISAAITTTARPTDIPGTGSGIVDAGAAVSFMLRTT